jgi:hypothetical protein
MDYLYESCAGECGLKGFIVEFFVIAILEYRSVVVDHTKGISELPSSTDL